MAQCPATLRQVRRLRRASSTACGGPPSCARAPPGSSPITRAQSRGTARAKPRLPPRARHLPRRGGATGGRAMDSRRSSSRSRRTAPPETPRRTRRTRRPCSRKWAMTRPTRMPSWAPGATTGRPTCSCWKIMPLARRSCRSWSRSSAMRWRCGPPPPSTGASRSMSPGAGRPPGAGGLSRWTGMGTPSPGRETAGPAPRAGAPLPARREGSGSSSVRAVAIRGPGSLSKVFSPLHTCSGRPRRTPQPRGAAAQTSSGAPGAAGTRRPAFTNWEVRAQAMGTRPPCPAWRGSTASGIPYTGMGCVRLSASPMRSCTSCG